MVGLLNYTSLETRPPPQTCTEECLLGQSKSSQVVTEINYQEKAWEYGLKPSNQKQDGACVLYPQEYPVYLAYLKHPYLF